MKQPTSGWPCRGMISLAKRFSQKARGGSYHLFSLVQNTGKAPRTNSLHETCLQRIVVLVFIKRTTQPKIINAAAMISCRHFSLRKLAILRLAKLTKATELSRPVVSNCRTKKDWTWSLPLSVVSLTGKRAIHLLIQPFARPPFRSLVFCFSLTHSCIRNLTLGGLYLTADLFLWTGNDDDLFAIDETYGNITVNGTIDAENNDFFSITVRVSCFIFFISFNATGQRKTCLTSYVGRISTVSTE